MQQPRDWSALNGAVQPLDGTAVPQRTTGHEPGERRDVSAEVERLRVLLAGATLPGEPTIDAARADAAAAVPETADAGPRRPSGSAVEGDGFAGVAPPAEPSSDASSSAQAADPFSDPGPVPDFLGDHALGADWGAGQVAVEDPSTGEATGGRTTRGKGRKKPTARQPPWARGPIEYASEEAAEAAARDVVLQRLAARQHSRAELERKLAAKDVPEAVGRRVLDRFADVGLVDDAAFAVAWVEQRARTKGLSRAALRRELATKGVAAEDIEPALGLVDSDAETEAAREMVRKKLRGSTGRLEKATAQRRLAGMLARRGYGSAVALRVINEEWHSLHDAGQ